MKLNLKTDYALRVLILLASRPNERFSIEALGRIYDIPTSSLMKIVSDLVRHGLLQSTRGRLGGIQMGQDPKQIRVGDIALAMEEPMELVDCSGCLIAGHCSLNDVICEAADAFMAVLMKYKLSDLVKAPAPIFGQLLDLAPTAKP